MSSHKTVFHDGFPVRELKFAVPPDTIGLDPKTKRELTICNLFINHELTVPDIIRVLDEDYRHVVKVLLTSGVVRERRQKRHMPPEEIERRRSGN
jgi:hypothetical protein